MGKNCIDCEDNILTVTQAQQPFCDQCSKASCDAVVDAACVIYHPDNDSPSELDNLNIINGASAEQIFEAIDDLIGAGFNIPVTAQDSASIDLTSSGASGHTIRAEVKISPTPGNALVLESDGLFVVDSYKIKINEDDTPDYLINQLVGGTDGIVSVSVIVDPSDSGLIQVLPVIDLPTLVASLCSDEDFQACIAGHESALSVTDSTTIDFTTSGVSGHDLTGVVKVSADAGNDLEIRADGLYLNSSLSPTANNGLTVTSDNTQLGGPLVKNTLINGQAFNLLLDVNTVQIGDVNELTYTQPSPYVAGDNRKLNVITNHNLKSNTAINTLIQSLLTLASAGDINSTHQFYAGAVTALYDFQATATMANGAQSGSLSGQVGLTTRNNATISFSGGPIAGVSAGVFLTDALAFGLANTTNQGVIGHAAGLRIIAPSLLAGVTSPNAPNITNYYGIHIGETDAIAAKITNKFGIYQIGTADINRFFGPVQNASSVTQFTSDERVKENIKPFVKGLKEIDEIETKNFNYTYNKGREVVGVIAQELEKVFPEAVEKGYFNTGEGEEFEDFRFIDQNVLFYTMLNAIKELSKKVKALESLLN